jgi:formyltetrahydrofolate-dependent phosphoribosylglycinamide formyltransferase
MHAQQDRTFNLTNMPEKGKMKIIVLISGNGSNLQALIDAAESNELPAEIALVVSNKSSAYGLERAKRHDIATLVMPTQPFRQLKDWRREYDVALANSIKTSCSADLIVLAGWMHILSQEFLETLKVPVINLHPALPGAFVGVNCIQRAYEAFQDGTLVDGKTGVMIHDVIPEVDMGRVICTQEVFIQPDESLEHFEERLHKIEHEAIVRGTRMRLQELAR